MADFAPRARSGIVCRRTYKESDMRWEIPQATEIRFGMEITLYIARR